MTQFGRKGPARPTSGKPTPIAAQPPEINVPNLAARQMTRRLLFSSLLIPLFLVSWWCMIKISNALSSGKHEEGISISTQCERAADWVACVRAHEKPWVPRPGALQLTLTCDAVTKGTGSDQIPTIALLVAIDDDVFALGLGKTGPIDYGTRSDKVRVGSKKITLYSGAISPGSNDPITIYRDTWKIEFAGREGFSFSGVCEPTEFKSLH